MCKPCWRRRCSTGGSSCSRTGVVTGCGCFGGMERGSGSRQRDLSHTARLRQFAKLRYPYHPLFRAGSSDLEIIGVRSDMLVIRLPDGTRRGVPAWMFDEATCATVRESSYPIVDAGSLLALIKLLELNGWEIGSARDERTSQSTADCDVGVAVDPSSTSTGKPRNRKSNPSRKQARVHRADSRVDRSGRRSSKTPDRRVQ